MVPFDLIGTLVSEVDGEPGSVLNHGEDIRSYGPDAMIDSKGSVANPHLNNASNIKTEQGTHLSLAMVRPHRSSAVP
jgi:hypothetical protein